MKMKQLLRYTSTLLRTAMLLGALALVNTQEAQAQIVSLTKDMPDAFETKTPTIGDGKYYFIQFYEETTTSPYLFQPFLGENGEGNRMHAMDYLPFAKNRQWTLEQGSDATHFKLKSKRGYYAYYDGTKYFLSSQNQATEFYFNERRGHREGYTYYELRVSDGVNMSREKGNQSTYEWADMIANTNGNVHSYVRFVQLKPTAAHIIYYREEGIDNSQYHANFTTTRHYLTYSGADYGAEALVDNGSLEGNDASCFFSPDNNTQSTIADWVGKNYSRGIKVESDGNESDDWRTQFIIRAKSVIPIGKSFRIEFDYKADANVTGVSTYAQAAPGAYNHYNAIGIIDFTTDWQHFDETVTVTADMGNNEGEGRTDTFQSIAFNLGKKTNTNFYFDNILITIVDETVVSSRKSIIPADKSLWTLPTAAVYHQDGLWTLEETGTDGEFYIKRYGTEQYLNARMLYNGNFISDLGTKDAISGKYKLEVPTANRYTPIQNNDYTTASLSRGMFYNWNGCGAGASSTGSITGTDNPDFRYRLGERVNGGDAIVGTDGVGYLTYADLGDNTKMIINGTSGMQLRVLMNRQKGPTGNEYQGPYVEKDVTIGSDGKAVVDLTYLELNESTTGTASVKMTYINGSDDKLDFSPGEVSEAYSGYNTLYGGKVELGNKSWNVNDLIYLQVNASAIPGRISKVTLNGTATSSNDGRRSTFWGAGYNTSVWSSNLTWNTADRSIINLTAAEDLVEVTKDERSKAISLDITDAFTNDPDKIATILVYETNAGGGTLSNLSVEVEYYPTYTYRHLNTIKAGWGSPSGTVNSISFVNENNLTVTNVHYLHHSIGDGWQVPQWTNKWSDLWNAAFYPVEVPVSGKDEFFQVLVGLRGGITTHKKIELTGTVGMSVSNQDYTDGHLYGATFTPTAAYQNAFKITDLNTGSYQQIVIKFGSAILSAGWTLHTYGGQWDGNVPLEEGLTQYTITLQPGRNIDDFTIYNTDANASPITISEIYYVPDLPSEMVNYNGGASPYSELEDERILWELEMEEDFRHYRLKNPNDGTYLAGYQLMTEPNDPNGETGNHVAAEIYTNQKFFTDFTLKWYIPVENAPKEIVVNYYVTHKESYLRTYADDQVIEDQEGLRKQGLSRDIDSDWKNMTNDPGVLDGFTQKTNHFEITHYIKKGASKVIEFPTVLNRNNDHIFFQRFYKYDEVDKGANGTGMDLDNLKAHVSLDTRDDGDVQYFLYKNGMVTGQKLDWTYDDGTDIPDGGMARNEQRRFNFTNSDGQRFVVAVDVSRYSDFEYVNKTNHYAGDLIEPSLTMRYLFNMFDAKEMAASLTDCPEGGGKWLESKEIHFGRTQVPYTKFKKVGYRGEFIGLRHVFSDYWVYDDPNLITKDSDGKFVANTSYITSTYGTQANIDDFLDQHLVSAVNDNKSGKIEVELIPGNTGIRRGGYNAVIESMDNGNGLNSETYDDSNDEENNYQGFYFYDKLSPSPKTEYGNSRFVVFRYPANSIVDNYGPNNKAYLNVYFKVDENTRYQLAQYTLIFDANMATRPWTEIKNGTSYANNVNKVKGTDRDPNNLRAKAGHPIAKVTFDYPIGTTYHYPSVYDSNSTDGVTKHNGGNSNPGGTIANSSPIPLTFGHTNYSFDGDDCNWGSYAMVTRKGTAWGNQKIVLPADDDTYGYGIDADPGMQKAFLYIDASEQPGDICAVDFEGEFCPDDKLMCTGWISGSNKIRGDTRCPGSITVTVKGEDENGKSNTIYRFCPGQIYELNNGYGDNGSGDAVVGEGVAGIDGNGNGATHVVWQQFFFQFSTDRKYERYWLEVNNNCVSSNGGDFMIDNVEVYTIVPEVEPEINTPLCVSVDETGKEVTEMRLLKLRINHNKLVSSRTVETTGQYAGTAEEGFVFLEKYKFLETFKTELVNWTANMSNSDKEYYEIVDIDFNNITLDALADSIEVGRLKMLPTTEGSAYKTAFDAAIIGKKSTWHSDNKDDESTMNSAIMYFRWSETFADDDYQPVYSFADAVNKKHAVYREVAIEDGEEVNYLVMNGNYPQLKWKTGIDYYVINTNQTFTPGNPCTAFNLCSECCKASTFRIDPPYRVLGLQSTETTNDYVVCEGQIPTITLNLRGYTLEGDTVDMKNLNFDWWLGDPDYTETETVIEDGNTTTITKRPKLATLENYHAQHEEIDGVDVKLDKALSTLRTYYPSVTSLDGIEKEVEHAPDPALTVPMIKYLKKLVAAGELVLHQTSVSVPAEKVSETDPYFYMVACPIHDDEFDRALNPAADEYVAYYCDEPQGLRIKVGEKAPTLKCGFVPNEHGFATYDYSFPDGSDPVLSIRLAKAAQFETVKNTDEEATDGSLNYTVNHLWLPIRNAQTQTASGVIQKSNDENIYLASTNDPTWDKKISKSMSKDGLLPVVGRIVSLTAINTRGTSGDINISSQNDENRLRVYFTENFEVREGYNYTLSLPFTEVGDVNTCDGTLLINLKIVPDYEVWTGAAVNPSDPNASNTDWNNDENWRRADGNTESNAGLNADELYVASAVAPDPDHNIVGSPLYGYKTNYWNYRTSKDRVLRKGFAPLYCTHILMMSDEWGNAPVLYDAIDGNELNAQTNSKFINSPFPNLRETSTPILKFDMQARRYDLWSETYGVAPDRGESTRPYDLIAEMYKVNSCDEIVFQPGTELRNAHLLNYNSAWMEYQLDNKRWYLLGSPLQGTISGEWYAPTGTAKQQTTYYDPVRFTEFVKVPVKTTDNPDNPSALGYYKKNGQDYVVATETTPAANTDYYIGYDRYSPAIYQRSWDKAKAVLYEIGSTYSTTDDSQTENLGSDDEGIWSSDSWQTPTDGADEYLDRLGYKPMGGNKANVAIKGIWSNTYNDAQVDYATGGFSVMVMNHLKNHDGSSGTSVIRLPKEDTLYDYYGFDRDGGDNPNLYDDIGTETQLSVVRGKDRAKNRGRLKTDLLLPTSTQKTEATASVYGDQRTYTRIPIKENDLTSMIAGIGNHEETVAAGISNLDYYLVENPFPCGLDMDKFFKANEEVLQAKYWLLTATGQHLVQKAADSNEWITSDGTNVGTAIEYPDPNNSGSNLSFYPHAVVAPGQGFFVQALPSASDTPAESITVTFNSNMQAQSRFGVKDGNGRTFTVEVGQTQRMEQLVEEGVPQYIDVDLDGNGIYGETIVVDGETVVEQEPVMVPVYEKNGDDYVLDAEGNKIPVLVPINEKVTIYNYKQEELDATHKKEYPLLARQTRGDDGLVGHASERVDGDGNATLGSVAHYELPGLVITAQRGNDQSSALVMKREEASNDFLPSEDTETFISSEDLKQVPMVYTLCGRLATTINSIHDFRSLPVGVESASDAQCVLTFRGVELLGDSIAFYDAKEKKLTPLESGMTFEVSGQTQNRYYLVSTLIQEEAAEETHLQIFNEGLTARVIASTEEPITFVRCFDISGRLVHSAKPKEQEYSFTMPRSGVYIIEAQTENDRKTKKVMAR